MPLADVSRKLTGAALAIAMCGSPTIAAAATNPDQSVSPLVVVGVYGTQASAQAVCGSVVTAAASAASQAQAGPGCVLPATDVPPPVTEAAPPAALPPTGDFGINWVLAGLGALILIGAIVAATNDDDDDFEGAISPA